LSYLERGIIHAYTMHLCKSHPNGVLPRRANFLHNILASPQSSIDDPETQATLDTTQITKQS